MPSFKSEMLVDGSWVTNALRFASYWEADRYGADLFSRWTMPRDRRVSPSDDDPNYYWHGKPDYKAIPLPRTEEHEMHYRGCVAAVCDAFIVLGNIVLEARRKRAHDERELAAERFSPMFLVPIERDVSICILPAHVRRAISDAGCYHQVVRVSAGHNMVTVSDHAQDNHRVTWLVSMTRPSGDIAPFTMRGNRYPLSPSRNPSMLETPSPWLIPAGGAIVEARDSWETTTGFPPKLVYLVVHVRQADLLAWLSPKNPAIDVANDARQEYRLQDAWNIRSQAISELPSERFTPLQKEILQCVATCEGTRRKREIAGLTFASDVAIATESLIAEGLLKRTAKGALTFTPEGKRAAKDLIP